MGMLGFNRRLTWVTVPAVLWALCAVAYAQGLLNTETHSDAPLPLRFDLAREGIRIGGRPVEISEDEAGLSIVMARPPGTPRLVEDRRGMNVDELPEGLELSFVDETHGELGPPVIRLLSGEQRPLPLPGGGFALLSRSYLLRFDGGMLFVQPRPLELSEPWGLRKLKRRLQDDHAPDGEGRPHQRRPGERPGMGRGGEGDRSPGTGPPGQGKHKPKAKEQQKPKPRDDHEQHR